MWTRKVLGPDGLEMIEERAGSLVEEGCVFIRLCNSSGLIRHID